MAPCRRWPRSWPTAAAQRTQAHLEALLAGERPATQQLTYVTGPILSSLIHHEYQHDCWVREVRAMLSRVKPDAVFSNRLRQVDGFWVLREG